MFKNLNEIYKDIYHPIYIGWCTGEIPNQVVADWAAEHGLSDIDCTLLRLLQEKNFYYYYDKCKIAYKLSKLCLLKK